MKMKKIAAVLTALSVLSGCSGNTVSEETVTTTGTTTEVVAVTTTAEAVTISEAVDKQTEKSSRGAEVSLIDLPPSEKPLDTTTTVVNTETIPHIELVILEPEVIFTEFDCVAMLIAFENGRVRYTATELVTNFIGVETDNPEEGYIKSWGCHPKAFVKLWNGEDYFESVTGINIIDLTASKAEDLYNYIDIGKPVAVWVTENLAEPEISMATSSGYTLYEPNECVVLAGYTDTAVCVWSVIEEKYVTYDRALFEQRYEEMGSMALTVVKE